MIKKHLLFRMVLSFIFIFLIADITACETSHTLLDSVLAQAIDTNKCSTPEIRYSCWLSRVQNFYRSSEKKESNCLDRIFAVCRDPYKKLCMQDNEIDSLDEYYQSSIESWKSIDSPSDHQFTLFINHAYFLDQCLSSLELSKVKKFSQVLNVYSCITRKWNIELKNCFLLEDGYDLNQYLIPGYHNLEQYCQAIVSKANTNPDINRIKANIAVLVHDLFHQKTIDSWNKELLFWYGSQLLLFPTQETLYFIRQQLAIIEPLIESNTVKKEEFDEILGYFFKVVSIVETTLVFAKEKSVDYLRPDDTIRKKPISLDTLRYFEKTLDNFYLQCFLRESYLKNRSCSPITDTTNTKFGAIKGLYAIKLKIKESIMQLGRLLDFAINGKTIVIEQVTDNTYRLTRSGKQMYQAIRRVGCFTNEAYLDQEDVNEIEWKKNHPIVVLIANNRHLISRIQGDGMLYCQRYHDLKHTDLQYSCNQKTFIQFYKKVEPEAIVNSKQTKEEDIKRKEIISSSNFPKKKNDKNNPIRTIIFGSTVLIALCIALYYHYYSLL